tara:strand:- start:607 stop:1599 length:993 start_codon:yes stop_codon:yes gene_type:complete
MALTLVEGAKKSNNVLQQGVIELLVKEDMLLDRLPFQDITGNGLTYNVETTISPADFFDVGDTWNEGTSTVTSATAVLKILGGDADVDNFLKQTRNDPNDLVQQEIESKTKGIKRAFLDALFYGYFTGGNTKDFDGLQYLIRSSTAGQNNTIAVATSSGTSKLLLMERLEAAVDLIKTGKGELIVMSKLMRRSINKYLHGVSGISYMDGANGRIQTLFDLPVQVNDHIRDNESADLQYGTDEGGNAVYGHNYADSAGGDDDGGSSIFVLTLGGKALNGIQNGPLTVEPLGSLETKDATRTRLKWYVAIMLQQVISCSKVTGIDVDGVVAA